MGCPSETRLQAFVDGELEPVEIAALSDHLDACPDCRTIIGGVQPVPLDDDTTTDRVGRYVLRKVLGKGGMGIVYEAVDPELHRVVALKVLRSDLAARQERLLKEAEAMAKLAHPNVVAIYDVGRFEARVFLVMALVEGVSLRHWLAGEARPLDAILDAFLQAAAGLRAAHDAGLVHRDFKPENVFVAKDGRVLVGDFGLAALEEHATSGEGSLAYMAPEQRGGGPNDPRPKAVDARADQWSFCASLREAVGTPPRWLATVLERGTRTEPAERFASMSELVRAIEAGRRRARRRGPAAVLAILGLAAIGMTAFVAYPRDLRHLPLCTTGSARLAAAWSPEVAHRVERAFIGAKSPLADGAWRKTSSVLDAHAEGWRAALRRTCDAPRPKDDAGVRVVEQRTICLSDHLETLRAVASSLERADASMLEQVPAILALLPPVSSCEDVRELATRAAPAPPEKRGAVDTTRAKLADAVATLAAGRYEEGLTRANDAFTIANSAGYLPILAEAYLAVGTAHGRLGHTKEAEQALDHAVSSASAGHAPVIAVRAWIQLMHFVGFEGKRYEDGYRHAEYAKAALDGMPASGELAIERLAWLRAMLLDEKRFTEALVVSQEELALVDQRFGPDHHLAAVANDGLAGVLAGQCKSRDAIAPQERSCTILEKEYGTPHPQVALCLGNLAALRANLGEHEAAIITKGKALAMFEQVTGHPNHVAMAHRNMARSLLELDRLAEASQEIDLAAGLSKSEADEVNVLLLRGDLRRREKKLAESKAVLDEAVARTLHAPPRRRIEPLGSLAETTLRLGRVADAAHVAGEAATAARTVHGSGGCRTAEPLRLLAEALIADHRPADALPIAEAAATALADAQVDPKARARLDATLLAARAPMR